jgi:hypothetical protein
MRRKAILVDLDGTLSNSSARKHFVERPKGEKKDFESFYDQLSEDYPNWWCLDLVKKFNEDHKILLVTGRPSKPKIFQDTLDWLKTYEVEFDFIQFRLDGDFRPDHEVKKEIFLSQIQPFYEVIFCLDDRKQVVDMWRSLGLTCLQCAEGNF